MRLAPFLLSLSLLAGAPFRDSLAQAPPATASASNAMTDKARELYTEGVQLFRQKKWAQAEASFEAAWALAKHYSIAANLADTKLQLGKHRAAADLLVYALANAPAAEVNERKHAEALLATAKSKIATVTLRVTPPDAVVTVDGRSLTAAEIAGPLFLQPGKVVVSARKESFEPLTTTIDATAGSSFPVEMTLQPVPAPVPSSAATATATAAVPPPERSLVPALVLGGVSVASFVVGGALFGVSMTQGAELRAGAPRASDGELACAKSPAPGSSTSAECDEWRAKAREAGVLGNAGIGLFVAGGVAAAGAVAAYFLWPASTPSSGATIRWRATPLVGTAGGGLVLHGSF